MNTFRIIVEILRAVGGLYRKLLMVVAGGMCVSEPYMIENDQAIKCFAVLYYGLGQ